MKNLLIPVLSAGFMSGSFIAGKYTTYDLEPLTTTFLRYIVALAFLSFLVSHYKPNLLRIKKKDLFWMTILGLSGIIGYHFFFFSSLRYTLVANTAIINGFGPVVTGILAAVLLRERLTTKNYAGIIITLIGVLVLVTGGNILSLLDMSLNFGDMLMLLAVISWGIYSILIKRMSSDYHSFTLTFYSTLMGVVMLFFLSLMEGGASQIAAISIESLVSVVYMGIFASGIGYLIYNYSINNIGPTKTSTIVNSAVPIFVAALAFAFFQEVLSLSMVISIVLIIVGLNFVMSVGNRKG